MKFDLGEFAVKSPKMQAVIEQAKKFAVLDAPLLIQGKRGLEKMCWQRLVISLVLVIKVNLLR